MDTLESAGRKLRSESSASLARAEIPPQVHLAHAGLSVHSALEAGVIYRQAFPIRT